MKRILLTGSNGLLGQKLVEILARCNRYNLMLTSKQEHSVFHELDLPYIQLDTTNKQEVLKVMDEFEPDVIVNAAAMTNVDQCERERGLAWRVNVGSVENLAHAAKLVGAHVVHISTDYVFDGKNGPYDELARPNPISYYGRTKLASENILRTREIPHTIARTMLLYGVGEYVKLNFALWLVKNLGENKPVRITNDQIGNPTLADDLAFAILNIIELERSGLYHVSGSELISRYDFAIALARVFEFDTDLITPVTTAALKQDAPRPLKSGFITLKAQTDLGIKLSDVQQGLAVFKNQLGVRLRYSS
jgi:dTDP-4-dehydrorhamnose reductase